MDFLKSNFFKFFLSLNVLFNLLNCASSNQENFQLSSISKGQDLSSAFLKYYVPIEEELKVNMPQYSLPLDLDEITNFSSVSDKYFNKQEQKNLLKKNGFVVVKRGKTEDITNFYKKLIKENIPIFGDIWSRQQPRQARVMIKIRW